MGTVTYPDERVARYLEEHFVAAHYDVKSEPRRLEEFQAFWTPTLIWYDPVDVEIRRSEGYLEPESFLAEMGLVRVRGALLQRRFDRALELARESPRDGQEREAELLYLTGVADYKASHDPKRLGQAFRDLRARLPDTDWAKRANVL